MIHPRGKDKALAVIQAYCDESGIHDDAPHCVVAGFVSTGSRWQVCEAAWERASGGVTFHGKRFFARDPSGQRVSPYLGWSDAKAEAYLSGLLSAIAEAGLTPIGSAIDANAFRSLSLDQRRYLTGAIFDNESGRYVDSGKPSAPYILGFFRCLIDGVRFVSKGRFKVSFVFEQQTDYSAYATHCYDRAVGNIPDVRANSAGLEFRPREGIAGLQAADLLAHVCYRRLGGTKLGENRDLYLATQRLAPMTDGKILFLNEWAMRDQLASVPKTVRRNWR